MQFLKVWQTKQMYEVSETNWLSNWTKVWDKFGKLNKSKTDWMTNEQKYEVFETNLVNWTEVRLTGWQTKQKYDVFETNVTNWWKDMKFLRHFIQTERNYKLCETGWQTEQSYNVFETNSANWSKIWSFWDK